MITNHWALKIKAKLDKTTLAIQMMEEAGEFIQAVSKYMRANGLVDNPTPVAKEKANMDIQEEFQDLLCVARLFFTDKQWSRLITTDPYPKYKRWWGRLEASEKTENK